MNGALMGVEGVIITGVYGSGKSSTVEEMAEVLEHSGVAYGALDLDWLWWFGVDGSGYDESRKVLLANLSAVVANYLEAGVERFLLAGSIRDQEDLRAMRASLEFPVRVAVLTVPIEVVQARLGSAVTTGRAGDLLEAERWLAEGVGSGLGDAMFDGDRPVAEVAAAILGWLGWL
jgi:hypothetical protein